MIHCSLSLHASGNNGELLVYLSVSVSSGLKLGKNAFAFNKLAKHSLVAIKHGGLAESKNEFRTVELLTLVNVGKHSSFVVAKAQVAIGIEDTVSTEAFLATGTTVNTESSHSLGEGRPDVALAIDTGTIDHGLKVLSSGGLLVVVKLKNKVAEFALSASNGEEHTGVRGGGVFVEGTESAALESVHLLNYITRY